MNERKVVALSLVLLFCLLLTGVVLAAPNQTVNRFVIAAGGWHVETASHTLDGTIGQPVVGVSSNGAYELGAGFWGGMGTLAGGGEYTIYLPLVLRNHIP